MIMIFTVMYIYIYINESFCTEILNYIQFSIYFFKMRALEYKTLISLNQAEKMIYLSHIVLKQCKISFYQLKSSLQKLKVFNQHSIKTRKNKAQTVLRLLDKYKQILQICVLFGIEGGKQIDMAEKGRQSKFSEYLVAQDLRPHSLVLSFSKTKQYRSRTGGLISLVLMVAIIAIFTFKIADVLFSGSAHMTITTTTIREDFSGVNISDLSPKLYFRFAEDGSRLLCQERQKHGINISIEINYGFRHNNSLHQNTEHILNVECQDQTQFMFPLELADYLIFGRIDFTHDKFGPEEFVYRRIGFRVDQCNKSISQLCGQYKNNLFPYLEFPNHQLNLNNLNDSQIVSLTNNSRKIDILSAITDDKSIRLNLYFTKVDVITDHSIWPEIVHQFAGRLMTNISTWLYDEESEVIYATGSGGGNQLELLNIAFKRSVYTYQHQRSFKKFDTVLSEMFAMLGLLFLIHGFLYSGYNQWSYKQLRMREMGVPGYTNPNLFSFYRESLKGLGQRIAALLCCCCLGDRQRQNRSSSQSYTQNEEYLDYRELLRKVQGDKRSEDNLNIQQAPEQSKSVKNEQVSLNSEIEQSLLTMSNQHMGSRRPLSEVVSKTKLDLQ